MASVLGPDAILESHAHSCTESQMQQYFEPGNMTDLQRERLRTHGHVVVTRVMEFNKEPLGVMRALLEQPEVQVNLPVSDAGDTLLHLAVSMFDRDNVVDPDLNEMSMILKRQDLDPNVGNRTGDTPLHGAARASSIESLEILLSDPRVIVAAVNNNQQTALHVACEAASPDTTDRLVGKIIETARSNVRSFPEFLNKPDRFGNTALHYAAERCLQHTLDTILLETVRERGRHEIAVMQNNEGRLPIHLAAIHGHLGIVDRLLKFDSHVDVVLNIRDGENFALPHHAVRRRREDILELCSRSVFMSFDLILELLAIADHKDMANHLLTRVEALLRDTALKESTESTGDCARELVRWGVSQSEETLVELIVKWHPELAVVAMDVAVEKRKEPIRLMLREHECVKREYSQMHKAYKMYVMAASAILVVAVLIATLTYNHCLTSLQKAQLRKDMSDLEKFGAPQLPGKFHIDDLIVLPRLAFFQAILATILAAFAALPFSFVFFFHEAVDDTKVKGLLFKTKALIVTASYFLMLSLGAIVFNFICSQFLAPYGQYKCASACEKAIACFMVGATLFLGINLLHYLKARWTGDERRRTPAPSQVAPLSSIEIVPFSLPHPKP